MAKYIYSTGNVVYLPIMTEDNSKMHKFYMQASVSGDIYPMDLYTVEELEQLVEKGELKKSNMIVPCIEPSIGENKEREYLR